METLSGEKLVEDTELVELSFDEIDESYLTQSAMLCQIS